MLAEKILIDSTARGAEGFSLNGHEMNDSSKRECIYHRFKLERRLSFLEGCLFFYFIILSMRWGPSYSEKMSCTFLTFRIKEKREEKRGIHLFTSFPFSAPAPLRKEKEKNGQDGT